jgi:hypothetical protein
MIRAVNQTDSNIPTNSGAPHNLLSPQLSDDNNATGFHFPANMPEGGDYTHRPSNAAFYEERPAETIFAETS